MNAYRTCSPPPAEAPVEWRWQGWFVARCSRCGARRANVQDAQRLGIDHETESTTVRHIRECSFVERRRKG